MRLRVAQGVQGVVLRDLPRTDKLQNHININIDVNIQDEHEGTELGLTVAAYWIAR